MHVDYSDVTVSHAIENNWHKQQCIIGLARTHIYNALVKFIICDCLSENPPSSHLSVFQEIPFIKTS